MFVSNTSKVTFYLSAKSIFISCTQNEHSFCSYNELKNIFNLKFVVSVNFVALTLLFGLLKEPTESHDQTVNGSNYTMLFILGYFSLLRFKCYCSQTLPLRGKLTPFIR